MKDLLFQECKWVTVSEIFLGKHYLKRKPAGILACYCLLTNEDMPYCVGGAVFTNGRIQYNKVYLEFSRLWISDNYGKNIESWFISLCLKSLQKKFPNYKGIVSWADLGKGHKGTIYLASNFVYDGQSRKVKKYLGANNKIIYQRTATNRDKLIGEDNPKNRFIYYFDKQKRELLKSIANEQRR